MSDPPTPPTLSPTFCFNTRFLMDFLRLSRSSIDDSISTNLNALNTPSTTAAFTPTSPSPSTYRTTPATRAPMPASTCAAFTAQVLFPSWHTRTSVLNYCAAVATSPDPHDPDLITRQAEDRVAQERLVDERLDPYSGRYFPRETKTERLAALLRNERAVEEIIRRRTWGVILERCAGVGEGRWEDAMDKWREGQQGQTR